MQQNNFPHPGKLLKEEAKAKGISLAQIANELKTTPSHVQRVYDGFAPIDAKMAVALEPMFGKAADEWYQIQTAYDIQEAKKHHG